MRMFFKTLTRAAWLLLTLAAVAPSAAAPIQEVAVFGGTNSVIIALVIGGEKETRLAGLIGDHLRSPESDLSAVSTTRVLIVFDKTNWPRFVAMWDRARRCMGGAPSSFCSSGSYTDQSGSTISMFATAPFGGIPGSGLIRARPGEIFLSVADKNGNYGKFTFTDDNQRALGEVREAITKISDYLSGSGEAESSSP